MKDHKLIIMRHAKSDWSTNAPTDFERPLVKRGVIAAENMGTWLTVQNYKPDRIVSSPAVRAKMTAVTVCERLGISRSKITWDKRIYESNLDTLLDVISTHARRANTMLLIGHNPGLDYLLNYLSREEPKRNQKGKLMTTAAIAVLVFKNGLISTGQNSANLSRLVRPKELDNI